MMYCGMVQAGDLRIWTEVSIENGLGKLRLTTSLAGLGTSFGYLFWYGYHIPAVRQRDAYYSKLEDQRAANAAA